MANLTEVKTTFTIDLSPYLSGLKSMLTMTQQTGTQLKPLLNLQIDKASFSELDKTYQEYLNQLKAAVPAAEDAANSSIKLQHAHEDEGKSTGESVRANNARSTSLNKGKREALEAFGAISFLTQGIVQLASSSNKENKELEKLNQGMSQGISAGFGLAGMLSTLGVVSGGTAVALGAIVTVGVAVLKFFEEGEERTKSYSDALNDFGNSFRGAATGDLRAFAENMRSQWEEADQAVKNQQQAIKDLDKDARRKLLTLRDEEDELERLKGIATAAYNAYKVVDKAVTDSVLNNAEVRNVKREAEIASIRNVYDRQRAEANKTLQDERAKINESTATAEEKRSAIAAVEQKYITRLAEIRQSEKEAFDQKQKEITAALERETEKRKRIAEEEARHVAKMADLQLQEVLSRVRLRGLEAGKSEEDINRDILGRKRMAVQAELALILKSEEDGRMLDTKTIERKQELENALIELAIEGAEMRISAAERERQIVLEGIQSIASNMENMFGSLFQLEQQRTVKVVGEEKKRRQATLDAEKDRRMAAATTAEERSAIENAYAEKKAALDAEMDAKARSQMQTMFALQKASQIANAMIATYSAAAAALAPPPLGLGPVFGPPVAAAAIAAGLANIAVIAAQEVPGLAEGTRISSPTFALLGEAGPEIVAPERTFIDVFKTDLAPRLIDVLAPQIEKSIIDKITLYGGAGQVQYIAQIHIDNFSGSDDEFDKLKRTVEDAMRRAGTDNASTLFRNRNRT
jgi:hypothetical protein